MSEQAVPLEIAPLQARGELRGFLLVGRWPDSTLEWLRVLILTVRLAAVPGLLPRTTVFRVREELPDDPPDEAVGLVMAEGTLGDDSLRPGRFADPQPAGLMVLHPPGETRPSLPEVDGVASGCVLLPGLPYLGLDHRAGWIEANREGTVTSMISRSDIDFDDDADTAVLGMLMVA